LAAPVFGRIWNGAVTLAVIGLDDLSPFGGRAGLAAPVLDRARNGNGAINFAPRPRADGV
jgi:hypothetical protein